MQEKDKRVRRETNQNKNTTRRGKRNRLERMVRRLKLSSIAGVLFRESSGNTEKFESVFRRKRDFFEIFTERNDEYSPI